ncbi:MAG: hypothetical protein ACLVL7_03700 [Anaerotruncus massiliensis (ex Togo et al. 2019)]
MEITGRRFCGVFRETATCSAASARGSGVPPGAAAAGESRPHAGVLLEGGAAGKDACANLAPVFPRGRACAAGRGLTGHAR